LTPTTLDGSMSSSWATIAWYN